MLITCFIDDTNKKMLNCFQNNLTLFCRFERDKKLTVSIRIKNCNMIMFEEWLVVKTFGLKSLNLVCFLGLMPVFVIATKKKHNHKKRK